MVFSLDSGDVFLQCTLMEKDDIFEPRFVMTIHFVSGLETREDSRDLPWITDQQRGPTVSSKSKRVQLMENAESHSKKHVDREQQDWYRATGLGLSYTKKTVKALKIKLKTFLEHVGFEWHGMSPAIYAFFRVETLHYPPCSTENAKWDDVCIYLVFNLSI